MNATNSAIADSEQASITVTLEIENLSRMESVLKKLKRVKDVSSVESSLGKWITSVLPNLRLTYALFAPKPAYSGSIKTSVTLRTQ